MTAPTPEPLDVAALTETLRRLVKRASEGGVDAIAMRTDEVGALLAALERIPELEGHVRDKNFELTGVHEALRKATDERDGWKAELGRTRALHRQALAERDDEIERLSAGLETFRQRAERVEEALGAVRDQESEEDWFVEDRPISLVHLGHLDEPNPDCALCARAALADTPASPKLTEAEYRAGLARARADYGTGESEAADRGPIEEER